MVKKKSVKKKISKAKKPVKNKKEVKEVFEIEDKKKKVSAVIESEGEIVKDEQSLKEKKEQIKSENKIIKWILWLFGLLILCIIIYFVYAKITVKYEHKGIDFEIVQEGQLILHRTSIPVIHNGQDAEYNFYLREDPRKSKVGFSGDLELKNSVVLNMSNDFNCGGYGMISIANLAQLHQAAGITLMQDPNAGCSETGKYTFIRIEESTTGKTEIEKFGPSCYKISIDNCEILQGTERYMVEMFSEINKMLDSADEE